VLVPLCGKAEDLAWLASRGYEVIGVELSEIAARAFFSEHDLVPSESRSGAYLRLEAGGVVILVGDIFALAAAEVTSVSGFYDRAALIALQPAQRARYVALLRARLPPGTPGLIVSFEYAAELMQPPPHPVGEPEVRALYTGASVAEIDEGPAESPRLRDLGAQAYERCYAIVL
jgi:thiopurine S-methyltransferase